MLTILPTDEAAVEAAVVTPAQPVAEAAPVKASKPRRPRKPKVIGEPRTLKRGVALRAEVVYTDADGNVKNLIENGQEVAFSGEGGFREAHDFIASDEAYADCTVRLVAKRKYRKAARLAK